MSSAPPATTMAAPKACGQMTSRGCGCTRRADGDGDDPGRLLEAFAPGRNDAVLDGRALFGWIRVHGFRHGEQSITPDFGGGASPRVMSGRAKRKPSRGWVPTW